MLIGGSTEAVPCEEKGIDAKFGSGANASCLDTSYSEVSRGGVCKGAKRLQSKSKGMI